MVFVFPHTLVRVVSCTLVGAFLKYYATIPAALIMTTNTLVALVAARKHKDNNNFLLYATVLAGLCAPFTLVPRSSSHRLYLKLSLLTTNLILIPCLVIVFFLPFIVPPEMLIQKQGFQHLNFNISGIQFLYIHL